MDYEIMIAVKEMRNEIQTDQAKMIMCAVYAEPLMLRTTRNHIRGSDDDDDDDTRTEWKFRRT